MQNCPTRNVHHSARRRTLLWRLRRTAHLPALPQNGRRAAQNRRPSPIPDAYAWASLVNLDIFWLRDESLEDTDNLPAPDVIAEEIVEELEAALAQFRLIVEDLDTAV